MTATARNPQVIGLKLRSKRLPERVAGPLRRFLNRLLGFEAFNAIYRELPPCDPLDLSQAIFDALSIRIDLDGEPHESLPPTGKLLIVANHPHGLIDGFAMDAVLGSKRPDGALMAIHALDAIPEYRGRLVLVGQRGKQKRRRHSLRGWRESYTRLSRGGALMVFPAGGVSRFDWRRCRVADQPWSPHVAALARRTGAPVLPLFIHGRNGLFFQVVGALCPPLQNLILFGELTKMRGRPLRITVGKPVAPGELQPFATDEEAVAFLRRKTEMLGQG